jgi:serine phosphatase RsbU (regulator of sigma subunit)
MGPVALAARRGGGRLLLWIGACALLAAAFAVDLTTGGEVSASLVYVIVVAYTAWFLGSVSGLALALLSALAWLAACVAAGQAFSGTPVLLWNLGAEVAIYSTMALLLGALRDHVGRIRGLADRLGEANRRLDHEAQAVGELQRELLPPAPPELPGYRWALHYETSTRAGGDYYDFVVRADGRVGLLIADASGHGTPAAVLMAMTRSLLHVVAADDAAPAAVLARLNRELGRLLPAGWFVTACYAVLDPADGTLEYSLAGHEPPLLLRAEGHALEPVAARGGPLLGPWPEAEYEAGRTRLAPGDVLFLYTDGLSEAVNPAGELLGLDEVCATLAALPGLQPETIRDRMLDRVARHRGAAGTSDDLTLVILGREP